MSARQPFSVTLAQAREAMGQFRSHKPAVRETRGGDFLAYCACGWESHSPYVLASEALRQAIYHLSQAADDASPENFPPRSGVSSLADVGLSEHDGEADEHAPGRTVKSNPAQPREMGH